MPGTPRRAWRPRSSNPNGPPAASSRTVEDTRTSPGPARSAIRAPMCTATPATSSSRSSHSPVCTPARMARPISPGTADASARAAVIAAPGVSASSIAPSPMICTTWRPCSAAWARTSAVWRSSSSRQRRSPTATTVSVEPTRSQNRIVRTARTASAGAAGAAGGAGGGRLVLEDPLVGGARVRRRRHPQLVAEPAPERLVQLDRPRPAAAGRDGGEQRDVGRLAQGLERGRGLRRGHGRAVLAERQPRGRERLERAQLHVAQLVAALVRPAAGRLREQRPLGDRDRALRRARRRLRVVAGERLGLVGGRRGLLDVDRHRSLGVEAIAPGLVDDLAAGERGADPAQHLRQRGLPRARELLTPQHLGQLVTRQRSPALEHERGEGEPDATAAHGATLDTRSLGVDRDRLGQCDADPAHLQRSIPCSGGGFSVRTVWGRSSASRRRRGCHAIRR